MIKTMAESLTEMKKEAGLSNRKLAELSGVPEGTVNSILSGNTQRPKFDDVNAMVSAMGRSIDEIFGEPQTPVEVQAAVVDHYALLIQSYKDQLAHYQDQVEAMRQNRRESDELHREQLRESEVRHKEHTANLRRGLWALLVIVVVLIAFLGYLCVDAAHGNWGLIQYPLG